MGTTGGTANRGTQSSLAKGGGHARQESGERDSGRRNHEEMSEHQVVGFLGRKIVNSMNDEDGDISDVRKENFNYYIGAEYGDERDGYSKFVTREVLETIEWVLPSVLRVFLSGDQIVTFDPVGPDDEDQAKQETDQTNYFVMRKNKNGEGGFISLHHWMKDCLMYPNGYIKAYMEEKTVTDVGICTGLNAFGVQKIAEDDDVEIIAQRSRMIKVEVPPLPMPPQPMPGAPGQTGPPPEMPQMPQQGPVEVQFEEVEVYDLKIRTTKKIMQLRIDPVPGEECLVDNDCVTQNLDEADFVCHRVRRTYTYLVEEGHDPDELDEIGLGEDYQWNDERVNRLFYEDEDPDSQDEDDPSMRQFWVHECYAWFDYEGTGVAQHRRVILIGDRVFENEETNYQPMIAMSAIMMQHKHNGMGYIEIVKDLQLLSSVLTRQLLDNTYKQNIGKKVFSEDALTEDGSTMEALLNTQAEYIPVRGAAVNAFAPEPTTSIIAELLPVIQHISTVRATRTGVTPEAGIAPNDLQEIRQEVFTNALDKASQRIEMLVRIFAETGYRQLMLKVHQLLRSHWDIETTMKLRGKWVDVDPQGWRDRTDMTINVGLGFNTKQQQLGMLVQLLSMQKEAAGQGLADLPKVYHTLEKLINAGGLGDVRQYFVDPESDEFQPPEPQPDAQMILAQAQAQALGREQDRKDGEAKGKQASEQAKNAADVAKAQAEAGVKQIDQKIAVRRLALDEIDMEKKGILAEGELAEKVKNIAADTLLKHASADKAMAEAAGVMIENSETFQQAINIVSEGAEHNPNDGPLDVEYHNDEDEDEDDGDSETTPDKND